MFSLIKWYLWYFCALPMIIIIAVCIEYWQAIVAICVLAYAVWYMSYKFGLDLWWEYKKRCDASHVEYHPYHKRAYEKKKLYRKLETPPSRQEIHCEEEDGREMYNERWF